MKKERIIFSILFILIGLFAIGSVYAANISACGTLSAGNNYTLTQNINTSTDCFNIGSLGANQTITLDCNNYVVNATASGKKAVYGWGLYRPAFLKANNPALILKNCSFTNFNYDVYAPGYNCPYAEVAQTYYCSACNVPSGTNNLNGNTGANGIGLKLYNTDLNKADIAGSNAGCGGGWGGHGGDSYLYLGSSIQNITSKGGIGNCGDNLYALDRGGNGGNITLSLGTVILSNLFGGAVISTNNWQLCYNGSQINCCGTAGSSGGTTGTIIQQATYVCGNGIIETANSEACDDNNTINGDGCNSSCRIESGWSCFGEPSYCMGICNLSNYNYNLPANSGWNDNTLPGLYNKTYNGTLYLPLIQKAIYNETLGDCNFKCNIEYSWNGNICVRGISYCWQLSTETECKSASNSVAKASLGSIIGADCGSIYRDSFGCNYSVSCLCDWNTTSCTPSRSNYTLLQACNSDPSGRNRGYCNVAYRVQDNCNTNLNTLVWIREATWHGSGSAINCESNQENFPCPNTARVPFFTLGNLIITLILLVLIYFILFALQRRNNNRKNEKSIIASKRRKKHL
jgi:cysteine-rich repeat protein